MKARKHKFAFAQAILLLLTT